MKKVLKLLLVLSLLAGAVFAFTACSNDDDNGNGNGGTANNQPADNQPADNQPTVPVDADLTVFLISHSPAPDSTLDDGSFNQGSADGIRRFVDAHGGSFQFLQPHEATNPARIDIFIDAIADGADVLVLPGFHFQQSVYEAQALFPDIYFIVVDTMPSGPPASNLVGVLYAEHESGFLAGYATVREGYTQLGFMGGNPVPAVVAFGMGFIQGAEHAAAQMGLAPGTVSINYMYLGGFGAAPEHTATANGWYAAGTEVIFVAAGAAGNSVAVAAEAGEGRWMIGVDVDQSGLSDRVLTSAMKALENSVYAILVDIANGTFPGGQGVTFNAANDGVALPMANSRFSTFTQSQYDAIFAAIAAGNVVVHGLQTMAGGLDHVQEMAYVVARLNIVDVNDL